MVFTPFHMACAYLADLIAGDPPWWPHPIRWTGRLIGAVESLFYRGEASPLFQRFAGIGFWTAVVGVVVSATVLLVGLSAGIAPFLGHLVLVWLGASSLATRSLHEEAERVAEALARGDISAARTSLGRIVSRDTSRLDEREIIRALIETVSENISDGIVAPLFYLALGGPVCAMAYKAVNTMDSMVGYLNERYRYFGWFAARADDVANCIPARLSGALMVGAAFVLRLHWSRAWEVMIRDAGKMKSPNAGYPEAAAAGALGVQLGGTNIYFGTPVSKPTLGEPSVPLSLEVYRSMVRLMYTASALAFAVALGIRWFLAGKLI